MAARDVVIQGNLASWMCLSLYDRQGSDCMDNPAHDPFAFSLHMVDGLHAAPVHLEIPQALITL